MTTDAAAHIDIDFHPVGYPRPAAPWSAVLAEGVADSSARMSVARTLDAMVRLAWQAFGADAAGILLIGDSRVASIAASGAEARRADCLQVDSRQGPGLSAIRASQPVVSPELRFDSRWRFWAPRVADLGFRSVLSLPLIDGRSLGALTLYSDRASNFDPDLFAIGLEFAQQTSLEITAAVERDGDLVEALV